MNIEAIKQFALRWIESERNWEDEEEIDADHGPNLGELRARQLFIFASIAESLNGINISSVVKRVEALETQLAGLSGIVANLGYEERIAVLEGRVAHLEPDPFLLSPEQRIEELEQECERLQTALDKEVVSLSRAIKDLASYHN